MPGEQVEIQVVVQFELYHYRNSKFLGSQTLASFDSETTKAALAGGLKVTGIDWLRGVDLNHRPLGYEPKRSILSPVDFIALPRLKALKNR